MQEKGSTAEVNAAIDATTVYCINKDNEIWFGQNGNWSYIPTQSGRRDARSIAVSPAGYAWYGSADGAVYRHVRPGDGTGLPLWGTTWDRNHMGKAAVLAVGPQDLVWCLNTQDEVWRAFDDRWQQLFEQGPDGQTWTYTVQRGNGLRAIVRREFKLKDPRDTSEIDRLVNLIVAQNAINDPNKIMEGAVLTLRY